MAIAPQAGQGQVGCQRPPAMHHGNDVVDFRRRFFVSLRNLTVLAAIAGTPPNQFFERAFHCG